MIYKNITQDQFQDMKADYDFYGTHTVKDRYGNEHAVKNDSPKTSINTMWHPLTDTYSFAEYGRDISSMYYCICYDRNNNINHGDIVVLFGNEYEVAGVKHFNTHDRIDVKKKAVA